MLIHHSKVGRTIRFTNGMEITIVKTEGARVSLALDLPADMQIIREQPTDPMSTYQQIARTVMSRKAVNMGRKLVNSMPPVTVPCPTT